MSQTIYIQYLGFAPKLRVREYTFQVKEAFEGPCEYTLTIPNEAFLSHRARYQDAPDICFLKLQRELAASANHPLKTHFSVSDAELDAYREAHSPKSARRY